MTTIRRLYAYLLAGFGLAMLSVAAANLAQLLVDLVLQSPLVSAGSYVRDTVALNAAMALVGLPAWLLHWLWIERTARAHQSERASTLRRVYVYLVLAGGMLALSISAASVLASVVDALLEPSGQQAGLDAIVRPLPLAGIAFAIWWAHLRLSIADRTSAGESSGSATLRRWYVYGAAFVGLLSLLNGTRALFETIWHMLVQPGGFAGDGLGGPIAASLVGLAVWLVHWIALPERLPPDDLRADGASALCSVYLFLALGMGVVGALFGASQLLYYAVGRLLGVAEPGGVGGTLVQAAAGPASLVVVYGAAWAYQRAALRQQRFVYHEAPGQAGVRRLYAYLVALVALAVLTTGTAGLLWTFGDLLLSPNAVAAGETWRAQVSLFATLVLVGLPVWLLHWQGRRADAEEAHSLARRLYVYLTLIAAALVGIGSLAAALYRLFSLALGQSFDLEVSADLAHAVAVASVAAGLGVYHWRVLRADAQLAQPTAAAEPQRSSTALSDAGPASPASIASIVVEISAADSASLERALAALRATGVQVSVVARTAAG